MFVCARRNNGGHGSDISERVIGRDTLESDVGSRRAAGRDLDSGMIRYHGLLPYFTEVLPSAILFWLFFRSVANKRDVNSNARLSKI